MSKRRYFSVLRNSDHHPYSPVLNIVAAVVLIGAGAALYLAWPDDAATQPQIAAASTPATAAASTPATTAAADESLCDKQAWPYVDQRCAQRVDAARGTRQVRIVTDKGHSVTAVTPVPIVEPKQKPAPQAPTVAQNDKPLGPPVAPVAAGP